MSYVSFSLKYRPQRFEDVVGQDHVSRTLMNAVRADRVAHAYLFSGPRGTGKTSSARVLAKALNCVDGPTPEPCGVCAFCTAVQDGRAMDVIEIDAASNRGIDEIRELREKVKYSPAEARSKVYILDEVHMLTTEAFNALLKTLEEPPAHSFFILATTEPHRVPATILSRCQRFDFRQIPIPHMVAALQRIADEEGIETEPAALEAIARASDGAMRDAESILDQVVAYTESSVSLEVVNAVLGVTEHETLARMADLVAEGDVAGGFSLVDDVLMAGKDVAQLMADLTVYLRDLLRIALGGEPSAWHLPGQEGRNRMMGQSGTLGPDRLLAAVYTLAEAQGELRSMSQHSLLLELTLAKLCRPPDAAPPKAEAKQAPATATAQQATAPQPAPAATAPPATTAPAPAAIRPPPGPPVVEGDLTLEAIAGHWEAIPVELKRMGRLPVGAFIREGQPTAYAGGTLTITFPPRYGFHHNQVGGAYREVVEEALERLFGRKIAVQCRLAEEGQAPAPQPAPAARETAPATPQGETQPVPEPQPQQPEPEPEPQSEPAQAQQEAVAEPEARETPEPVAEPAPAVQDPVDRVVEQTLSLFEGSRPVGDEDP